MVRDSLRLLVSAALLTSAMFSGCLADDKAAGKDVAGSVPGANETVEPAEIFKQTVPLEQGKSPAAVKFTVDKNWTKIIISARISPEGLCHVVAGEGQAAPKVEFKSPSQTYTVSLAGQPVAPDCQIPGRATAVMAPSPKAAEKGEWTITISARGVGARVALLVKGE
ncbi:MAG: hypothetical protein HYT80_03610 [Euryarchaeota archaeon]|nr:hypothetical protein [Euryarchaeota archaeon]